jgi:hypothetical protein
MEPIPPITLLEPGVPVTPRRSRRAEATPRTSNIHGG